MSVGKQVSNYASKNDVLMLRLDLVPEWRRDENPTPLVHQQRVEDVPEDARSSAQEITKRQPAGQSDNAPVDPFQAAHFDNEQLKSFVWYDRSPYPDFSRPVPPAYVCRLFQRTLLSWIEDFKYPQVPERQMFYRHAYFIMVAHWENFGGSSWPEGTSPAQSLPVVHDKGIEGGKAFPHMPGWLSHRLSTCLPEWQSGLILLPPLRMTLSYEIAYSQEQWKDPVRMRGQSAYPWIELPELPRPISLPWVILQPKTAGPKPKEVLDSHNIQEQDKFNKNTRMFNIPGGISTGLSRAPLLGSRASRENDPKTSDA
ncbi:MAG: hypothetical protein M1831_007019 [Alyxoria varia]|nr:MAG: hypothetical protein M1831_007019 [Alyxoria varia]